MTIEDLGILRDVYASDNGIVVAITPTYCGCPAMQTIDDKICLVLANAGIGGVTVETRLAPAWTTDWITESGREKLLHVGIAPPAQQYSEKSDSPRLAVTIACPQCSSGNTELVREFGSAACKALYRCLSCREPFDYFKCF